MNDTVYNELPLEKFLILILKTFLDFGVRSRGINKIEKGSEGYSQFWK